MQGMLSMNGISVESVARSSFSPPLFLSFFEESEARERCDYDEWDKGI